MVSLDFLHKLRIRVEKLTRVLSLWVDFPVGWTVSLGGLWFNASQSFLLGFAGCPEKGVLIFCLEGERPTA